MRDIIQSRDLFSNADRDAVEIGELYRKARTSVVASVRYLLEAGQRLIAKKDSLNHSEWLPWLEANAEMLGFDTRMTASRLMRAAQKCNASVTFDEVEALQISRQIWGHNGTGKNEWYTPAEHIELAREVLGEIDLDPATHTQAQTIVRAARFFTKEDDGLKHEWHGRVWLNPPYAQPLIAQFVSKMCSERAAGHIAAAIMLTHNYTETAWFRQAASVADAICFTCARVKFYEPGGLPAKPKQGQAFFYFGDDIDIFDAVFSEIGWISQPYRRSNDVRPGVQP